MNRRDFIVLTLLSTVISQVKAGAWEVGGFDNDDALEWVDQCIRSEGTSLILSTLNAALTQGYLEATNGSTAIAAAEVVAASKGKANKTLPKELASWLKKQQKAEIAKLAPIAIKAISRIANGPKSELQELWLENKKDFPAWKRYMQNLMARLK